MSYFCGSCCEGVEIVLTQSEYEMLRTDGTVFAPEPILHPPADGEPDWASIQGQAAIFEQVMISQRFNDVENVKNLLRLGVVARSMNQRQGLFQMLGRCGNLGEYRECTGYERRPEICREFRAGSQDCLKLRERDVVDVAIRSTVTPVEITKLR